MIAPGGLQVCMVEQTGACVSLCACTHPPVAPHARIELEVSVIRIFLTRVDSHSLYTSLKSEVSSL